MEISFYNMGPLSEHQLTLAATGHTRPNKAVVAKPLSVLKFISTFKSDNVIFN